MSDDEVELSDSAFAALHAFINDTIEQTSEARPSFQENWNLSQFWYTEETSAKICNVILRLVEVDSSIRNICLISCPSIFLALQESYRKERLSSHCIKLFEYDRRFAVFDDFQSYDYNNPLLYPKDIEGTFDIIIADPPYLSEECLLKTLMSVKSLIRDLQKGYILLLTGQVMRDIAKSECGLRPVQYKPTHENKLCNEFCLYTNFEYPEIIGCFEEDNA